VVASPVFWCSRTNGEEQSNKRGKEAGRRFGQGERKAGGQRWPEAGDDGSGGDTAWAGWPIAGSVALRNRGGGCTVCACVWEFVGRGRKEECQPAK